MTGAEMERAIEFLLKNQASFDSGLVELKQQIVELKQQIAETNKQLLMHAETQTELIQIVTRNAEEQRQFNVEFRAALRQLAAAQTRTDERVNRTTDNLNLLAETVRRFVEGRG